MCKRYNQGSAMVMVLILVAIGAVTMSFFLLPSGSALKLQNIFRKKLTLENRAEEGFQIAVSELTSRANAGGFAVLDQGIQTAVNGGQHFFLMKDKVLEGDSKLNVSLKIDSTHDITDPNDFPRFYLVHSSVYDPKQDVTHIVEGRVSFTPRYFSEFTFGLMMNDGQTHNLNPSLYRGNRMLFAGFTPNFGPGDHTFEGEVVFTEPSDPDAEKPYNKNQNATITFKNGYSEVPMGEYNLPEDLWDSLAEKANNPSGWSSSERLCLEFKPSGRVARYECDPSNFGPTVRVENRYGALIDEVDSDYLILHSDQPIHVKGIVNGKVSISSNADVVIEGDIQYHDQSEASSDRFAIIAQGDIVVPRRVPFGDGNIEGVDQNVSQYEGLTNFSVENDRDRNDREYGRVNDGNNRASVLDLDGVFIAKGSLNIEGLNDYDHAQSGISIPGKDGNVYSTHPDDPNYLYYKDGGEWKRKAEPVFCAAVGVSGPCPLYAEAPRKLGEQLWFHGSLIAGEYSRTRVQHGRCPSEGNLHASCYAGFWRRVINEDPSIAVVPPPGTPATGEIRAAILWKKSFRKGGS